MKELLKTLAYEFKFKQNIPNQGTDFSINVILNWLYGIIGLVAVGFIVYAAVIFITSGGDASKAEKAKTGIFYAVVGLIVVIMAAVITAVVTDMATK